MLGLGLLCFIIFIYERTKYHFNIRKAQSAIDRHRRIVRVGVNILDPVGDERNN